VSKLASREMAICTVTANESHSYSLFVITSEKHFALEKEAKKIFVLARREISIRRTRRLFPGKIPT